MLIHDNAIVMPSLGTALMHAAGRVGETRVLTKQITIIIGPSTTILYLLIKLFCRVMSF